VVLGSALTAASRSDVSFAASLCLWLAGSLLGLHLREAARSPIQYILWLLIEALMLQSVSG